MKTVLKEKDTDFEIIPEGTSGVFRGIPVTLESYTDQGLIWLKADTYEGHNALYEHQKSGGVSPENLRLHFVRS